MADSEDNWPNYDTFFQGSPKHLHAIGVLSSCYNSFERLLLELYLHHLNRRKIPLALSTEFYLSRDEKRRLSHLNSIFKTYEKSEKVRNRVGNLTEYFEWCSEVRNTILHAEVMPTFIADHKNLHLGKRKGRYTTEMWFTSLELNVLRGYADKIQDGRLQAAKIALHLLYRDTTPSKRSFSLRSYGLEPLPRILDVPEKIQLSQNLNTIPIPRHLRKSSPQ